MKCLVEFLYRWGGFLGEKKWRTRRGCERVNSVGMSDPVNQREGVLLAHV